jgi:hypothetical protein
MGHGITMQTKEEKFEGSRRRTVNASSLSRARVQSESSKKII